MTARIHTEREWSNWIAQELNYMRVKRITVAARIRRAKELLGAGNETGEFNRRLLIALTQGAEVAAR